jgi:hypothetical protein
VTSVDAISAALEADQRFGRAASMKEAFDRYPFHALPPLPPLSQCVGNFRMILASNTTCRRLVCHSDAGSRGQKRRRDMRAMPDVEGSGSGSDQVSSHILCIFSEPPARHVRKTYVRLERRALSMESDIGSSSHCRMHPRRSRM